MEDSFPNDVTLLLIFHFPWNLNRKGHQSSSVSLLSKATHWSSSQGKDRIGTWSRYLLKMGAERWADTDISMSKFNDWSPSKSLQKSRKEATGHVYTQACARAIFCAMGYLNDVGGIWGDLLCFRDQVINYQVKLGSHPVEGLQTMNGRPSYFFYGASQIKE